MDADFECLNSLFSCHGRLFRHIFCSVHHFMLKNRAVRGNPDVHREDICTCFFTEDTCCSLFFQKIFGYYFGHFLPALCHTFFHYTVIGAHDHQSFFLQVHSGIPCHTGDTNDRILQPSQTVQRHGNIVPVCQGRFHGCLICRMYLLQRFL